LLLAGLLSLPPLAFWIATARPAQELRYGEFKKRLTRKEVRSVKIGPTELTGVLTASGPDGLPVRFRTSRVGMESDEDLPPMLEL
jgi:hypothetical protein